MLWCLYGLRYVNLDVFMIPWKKVNIFEIFGVWHANRGQTKYGIYKVLKNVVDVAFLFSFSFSFFDLIKKYYFIYWLIFRLNEYYYNERNNPIDCERPRPRPVFMRCCWAKPTWMGGVVLLPLKMEVRLVIFSPLD